MLDWRTKGRKVGFSIWEMAPRQTISTGTAVTAAAEVKTAAAAMEAMRVNDMGLSLESPFRAVVRD